MNKNNSPFIKAARDAVKNPATNEAMKIALRFLLANAVGRHNAVPIGIILAHFRLKGIMMTSTQFQQTILKETRDEGGADIFIASSNMGYFLIAEDSDASVMVDFYTRRINSEAKHLQNLKRQL